jgi:N-acetylglucosamine kinase-like BadF-type ATPase
MYYIGIDGGGTKTKFSIMNEWEEIVGTIDKGTCHFNQVGFDGLEQVLREGFHELLQHSKIDSTQIKRICLGLAGFGEVRNIADKIRNSVKVVFEDYDYLLLNDAQIALAGALGGQDGILIIAGTGSIGLSLNKGQYERSGGWGYQIGDEGSAYWIGRRTIEYYSKAADGRLNQGMLYHLVKEKWGLKNDYDLILYMESALHTRREQIAEIAPLTTEAARNGDIYALDIIKEAGRELARIINHLAKSFKHRIMASYIGGVFKAGDLITHAIEKHLNEEVVQLVAPVYPPEVGACLIAKRKELLCTELD